jgi:two-component system sensor histidine kinase CpxA
VRRLFLRIFLVFWVLVAAVAAMLIVTSPFFTRARPGVERWQRGAERVLRERLQAGVEALARGGDVSSAPGWRHRHTPVTLYLVRPGGAGGNGTAVPPEVLALAERVAATGEERAEREGALHLVGRPATTAQGERVVLVAAARRPPTLVDLLEPRVLLWRLVLLTAGVGVVCYWLARTLTAPLTALRTAVGKLASGDLSARAAPSLTRRRDEIGELARDFDTMAARVETLLGAQRRLVRDVSHEVRSPLARLQVALELARSEGGGESAQHLDRIALEAARLEALVGQLLTLSRLEVAEGLAKRDTVDVVEVVEALVEDAAFEASQRAVQVRLLAETRPVLVEGEADRLASALENVLRNAVRYTAPASEVEVAVRQVDEQVEVAIRDRGPGVPEEYLERIFEPFVRVDSSASRQGGAGLGLAIAARAVALHRGTISARNRRDGGLEVLIRLPGKKPQ